MRIQGPEEVQLLLTDRDPHWCKGSAVQDIRTSEGAFGEGECWCCRCIGEGGSGEVIDVSPMVSSGLGMIAAAEAMSALKRHRGRHLQSIRNS